MEKMKVSEELGKALDFLIKSYERENDKILKYHSNLSYPWKGKTIEPLNKLSLEDMAKCLIIGYEVEKTPEEKLADLYIKLDKKDRFDYAYGRGIDAALNILDIKVKGINE